MADDAGADFIGLVGPMPSGPGVLDHDAARAIAAAYTGNAEPVLLTASQTAEAIAADARRVGATHVQVVRHIDRAEAHRLSGMPLTYFQIIHVEDRGALDLVSRQAQRAVRPRFAARLHGSDQDG